MMYLYENDNTLVWAGQIVSEELHTKDEGKRKMTLDELEQIAEHILHHVSYERAKEAKRRGV